MKVLPLTDKVPELARPPPKLLAKVLPLTVAVPKLARPPPAAELLAKKLCLSVNVNASELKIPPPR